ncbi:MAG: class I SAM-dependent methyltransferase, partial [Rhodospirillales bacterium]
YQGVLDRFADPITQGTVTVHRKYSADAAKLFDDRYFDWVYIDGMHTYDAVAADLRDYLPKVNPDGFICGHDYTNHPVAQRMNFGVIEAVNEFVRQTPCSFLALTLEPFPSYVLGVDENSERCREFTALTVHGLPIALQVDGFENRQFSQIVAEFSDGTKKVISRLD